VSREHGHGGGHGHDHALPTGNGHRRPLAIVLAISSTILVVEVVGALVSGSLALLADAGHLLTDVAGLALALVAVVLADRPEPGATAAPRCSPPPRRPRCCWPSAGSSSSRACAG
jgi:cobalt-zinc-cadmium efflux system protein